MKFWEYLKEDAQEDAQIKAGLNFFIRIFIAMFVKFFEYLGLIDYVSASEIVKIVIALSGILMAKDFLLAKASQLVNPIYNLVFETFMFISILLISLIANADSYARDMTRIEPNFLIAISLIFIVGVLLNWGIAMYKITNKQKLTYPKFIVGHNLVIFVQALLFLAIGIEYSNPIPFSNFYPLVLDFIKEVLF